MNASPPYVVTQCRGVSCQCPNALPLPADLLPALEDVLQRNPWLRRLQALNLRGHHQLRVSLCACANGCSQPQIADIGLLAAQPPLTPQACIGCGACVTACPDGLVRLHEQGGEVAPVIEAERCLSCGACVRACAPGFLRPGQAGLRMQLGGKLGRRPLLAAELPGILNMQEVLTTLQRSLAALEEHNQGQERPTFFRLAELRRSHPGQGLYWLEEGICAP